jgi:hypothetical protein
LKNGVFWAVTPCVALVRSDVSEELSAYFIEVIGIGELGTTPAVTSNLRTLRSNTKSLGIVTLMKEVLSSYETSILQESHGVTSQKTAIFIVTAVETSNFTQH